MEEYRLAQACVFASIAVNRNLSTLAACNLLQIAKMGRTVSFDWLSGSASGQQSRAPSILGVFVKQRGHPYFRSMATNITGTRTQTRSQTAVPSGQFPQAASSSQGSVENGSERMPLKLVVKDAVKRWFNEAHKEAVKGEVKQQALLGQMLIEGYGCKANPELGKDWTDKARRRGYKMAGVYCQL